MRQSCRSGSERGSFSRGPECEGSLLSGLESWGGGRYIVGGQESGRSLHERLGKDHLSSNISFYLLFYQKYMAFMLKIQLFLNFDKKWGRIPTTCRKSLTITHTINTINYVVLPSQGLRSPIKGE